MAFSSISQKTIISSELINYKPKILADMRTAYEGSPTAKIMFDNWINAGKTININYVPGKFRARNNQGTIEIDLSVLDGLTYINNKGIALSYSLIKALLHEFGHAVVVTHQKQPWTDCGLR